MVVLPSAWVVAEGVRSWPSAGRSMGVTWIVAVGPGGEGHVALGLSLAALRLTSFRDRRRGTLRSPA